MQQIRAAIAVKEAMLNNLFLLNKVEKVIQQCVKALQNGGKILFAGNGGSAADAQHLAAELSGRFYFDRPPLYAEALHVNTSYLTAVGNDYGYEQSFSRMAQAICQEKDVFFLLSTSGNSPNIIAAAKVAKAAGTFLVGMTGERGGELLLHTNLCLQMPSNDTPRIQEAHMLIGHIVCEEVEKRIFGKQK